MSLAWVSTAVQMFISTNAVVGLTEVVTELVRLREEVTELRKVGILITLKQHTPHTLHAVGCAGSGERGCGGGRRGREENGGGSG